MFSLVKDGNRISEIGKIGTDKVEKYYEYTVENRLAAVYDADELLMAAAYDGDGNRVFQLNYNLHTDEDWKGNSGNGNGSNKDNAGSGNNGKGSSNNGKGNSKSKGTDDAGYGNATNAEENNSQNQCGILFPVEEEVSEAEQSLIDKIKTTGKEKNYELIEYINDVNREYVEVLVEQNINGKTDTSYIYGVDRLSLDRFDGSIGYYLYDPRGSVAGITNEEGQVYQSYRYSVTGEITFGAPQYENEYTYNGESYNPNIESQYLRARYYNVVTASFLTEDSYLGDINEPLTLNRYNYCVSSYLNYQDPSGYIPIDLVFDLGFTIWDGVQYLIDPSAENEAVLAVDLAALMIPYIPAAVGRVGKIANKADKGVEIVQAVDNAGKISTIGLKSLGNGIYDTVFDTSKNPLLLETSKQMIDDAVTSPSVVGDILPPVPVGRVVGELVISPQVEKTIKKQIILEGIETAIHASDINGLCEGGSNVVKLPEYDGKTTHGVLVMDDGTQISLVSGNGDPRYTNYRNNGHVEQKAALYMRENNITSATVYHNNTNGTCGYCNTMTATFLPEGASLTVVPPKNAVANNSRAIDYVKTYIGTSNDPKVSPRYKGN